MWNYEMISNEDKYAYASLLKGGFNETFISPHPFFDLSHAVGCIRILSRPCYADVMYSYQSNALNPLYNSCLPMGASPPDSIDISFTLPAPLAADSTYNVSVSTSSNYVDTWKATDTLFDIVLTGVDAPILLVPSPGLIAGGALTFCDSKDSPCFGGAIVTNNLGNIVQWNLVADGAPSSPFLTFITYNNSDLGSIDGLGSTQNGSDELELNQLNGQTGVWVETSSTSTPEPASLALLLPGLAGLGFAIRARARTERGLPRL
jgi:hypothetical protein